jgi:3',5'-cyclic AMP phosphodiesterase CpdA
MMARPFLLAQVSDLHVMTSGRLARSGVDTPGMVRSCVKHILALNPQPDAVAVTGDLADHGHAGEYDMLRELLAPLGMPVYLIPGNHDDRESLRAAFQDHAYLRQSPDFVQYVIDAHPLRIVALDTLIPGQGGGEVGEESLAWLARTLESAADRPTVVLMHHPPFTTFISYMDNCGLRNPEALAAVIGRHPQVHAVLCGHLHRPIATRFAGTLASTSPSPVHQVALDFEPGAPLRLVREPPAYRLHAYAPETGLVSHTMYVGEFAAVQ